MDDDDDLTDTPTLLDRVAPATRAQWVFLMLAAVVLASITSFVVARETSSPSSASVEVGFLRDMLGHHDQAVQMSLIEIRNGLHTDVKVFAQEILRQQSFEIGLMTQKLDSWGYGRGDGTHLAMGWMGHAMPIASMPGMASEKEMTLLGEARGAEADALFVRLMQDHHRGGADMAGYAASHTRNSFIKDLATRMRNVQLQEIREMEAARERVQLRADPPGWEPADIR